VACDYILGTIHGKILASNMLNKQFRPVKNESFQKNIKIPSQIHG